MIRRYVSNYVPPFLILFQFMAEQNNEKQTINFAGREIDRKEFGRRV